jgi:hypothetical protein
MLDFERAAKRLGRLIMEIEDQNGRELHFVASDGRFIIVRLRQGVQEAVIY